MTFYFDSEDRGDPNDLLEQAQELAETTGGKLYRATVESRIIHAEAHSEDEG